MTTTTSSYNPTKYQYDWKTVNITPEDKDKLHALVQYFSTTGSSKGVMSSILSRLINAEYESVIKK